LAEEERGTMPRLFSTPTPQSAILYGKFIASALTVLIQMTVLLIFGSLVFNIYWGELLNVALVLLGIVVSASTFGIFFISFIKTNKQAGAMMGGGLTLMGMIGMARIFTMMGSPNTPPMVEILSLLVPQGWAVRGISASMDGGSQEAILISVLGMFVWGVVFFLVGNTRFKNRYV
jgi:ABC-2 type transport system permease protein